ncbi:hypothetical protein [Pseudoruegeria sp. SK021]|uniref:hypothetical protein n=1 Tax=Pseudoruegeria sp. SK021 TaxID=1933035 RepID=UPI000A3230C0|nr:hypothetical protein [Pseudoruegeria sp. SK021]
MLNINQFDTTEDLPKFYLPVLNLKMGNLNTGPVEIPVSYGSNWEVIFHLGEFASYLDAVKDFFSEIYTASISLETLNSPVELMISKRKLSSEKDRVVIEARARTEPILLAHSTSGIGFKAVLISAPTFLQKPITLRDAHSNEFEITPPTSKDCTTCIVSSSQNVVSENLLGNLQSFLTFLTFVKGSHSGFGNLTASSENGEAAIELIGFTKNDSDKRQTNWFDVEVQNHLPEVFFAFSSSMTDAAAKHALRQSINFYRASNASRGVSLEMSIIAAHTALEAIVNFILESKAGWTKNKSLEKIPFSDKLRAATAFYGLQGDPLEHSPNLLKLSSSRQNQDAFELISFFRNKLVHQDPKLIPSGTQLLEIWLVAQWLVEILVFGVIGH